MDEDFHFASEYEISVSDGESHITLFSESGAKMGTATTKPPQAAKAWLKANAPYAKDKTLRRCAVP